MMTALSLQTVADRLAVDKVADSANGSESLKDIHFTAVSIDSRKINTGDLYVALKGERFDGHNFIEQVQHLGACAALVERRSENADFPQLLVDNTVQALGAVAEINRQHFHHPLIAITGSCGKTTVKEMVAAILSGCGRVLATEGNLNNHIGVPLTLFKLLPEHDYAVIEMGASAAGEIAYLADMAKPTVALVNNVAAVHVEGFGSVENIAKAKSEIYQSLTAADYAVINVDEPYASDWLEQNKNKKILTFSACKPASVEASNIQERSQKETGYCSFDLEYQSNSVSILLPLLGRHNVMNALAAATCCVALGVSLEKIQQGLESMPAVNSRGQVKAGLNDCRVIDDSYNANPAAVKIAMDMLSEQSGIKVFVLGDMGELGELAEQFHTEVGEYAKSKDIQMLLSVGELSVFASGAFNRSKQAKHFLNKAELIDFCQNFADQDVVFLCKGSRYMKMEEVVNALVASAESVEGTQSC